jgi:hypothetical protein
VPIVLRRLLPVLLGGLLSVSVLAANLPIASARSYRATKQPTSPAASSAWTKPQVLGPGVRALDVPGTNTGVAADGGSLTAWMRHGIRARWRDANGHLGPQQLISPASQGDDPREHVVAVAPDGTAVIFWTLAGGPGSNGEYARFRYRNGSLGPVQLVTSNPDNDGRAAFFGPPDGQPRLIWTQLAEPTQPQPGGLFLASLDAVKGLAPPIALGDNAADRVADTGPSFGPILTAPTIAFDRHGNALIVWVDGAQRQVQGRIMSRSGTLSPILRISPAGAPVNPYPEARLSLSPDGIGHVVWSEGGTAFPFVRPETVQARQIDVSGNLGPTLSIATIPNFTKDASSRLVDVATFTSGHSLVVWAPGLNGPVFGRLLSHTTIGRPFRISGTRREEVEGNFPSVAAHGQRATVIWTSRQVSRDPKHKGDIVKWGLRSREVTASGVEAKSVDIVPDQPGIFIQETDLASNAAGAIRVSWRALYAKGGMRVMVAARR